MRIHKIPDGWLTGKVTEPCLNCEKPIEIHGLTSTLLEVRWIGQRSAVKQSRRVIWRCSDGHSCTKYRVEIDGTNTIGSKFGPLGLLNISSDSTWSQPPSQLILLHPIDRAYNLYELIEIHRDNVDNFYTKASLYCQSMDGLANVTGFTLTIEACIGLCFN